MAHGADLIWLYFFLFKAIIEGKPIKIFNNGDMLRDFTYIDDIVQSLTLLLDKPAESHKTLTPKIQMHQLAGALIAFLISVNSNPTPLLEFIKAIEECLGKKAKKVISAYAKRRCSCYFLRFF